MPVFRARASSRARHGRGRRGVSEGVDGRARGVRLVPASRPALGDTLSFPTSAVLQARAAGRSSSSRSSGAGRRRTCHSTQQAGIRGKRGPLTPDLPPFVRRSACSAPEGSVLGDRRGSRNRGSGRGTGRDTAAAPLGRGLSAPVCPADRACRSPSLSPTRNRDRLPETTTGARPIDSEGDSRGKGADAFTGHRV